MESVSNLPAGAHPTQDVGSEDERDEAHVSAMTKASPYP
jgi:hypothetical protein